MKIRIDDFLTAEELGEASKDNPVYATIKEVTFLEAYELPFESDKGKYELALEINGEATKWLANKTSLRALKVAFKSDDASTWIGKEIKLWTMEQLVNGKPKKIVYANAN